MTKQSQAHIEPEEKPSADLLLRRYKIMDEKVAKLRKESLDAGLHPKYMSLYFNYRDDFHMKIHYENWLKSITNPKTGKFYQYAELERNGDVPPGDYSNEPQYPYRKLNGLFKVRTGDGKLWLQRHETWYGLTKAGQEVHISVNDLDYVPNFPVEHEIVPKDPEYRDGPSIRVAKITNVHTIDPPGLERIYLTPYSKEKTDEILKYSDYLENNGSGPQLALKKIGRANEAGATYEQFIAEDFDATFERIMSPSPDFKDWHREFNKRIQAAEEANHQYG